MSTSFAIQDSSRLLRFSHQFKPDIKASPYQNISLPSNVDISEHHRSTRSTTPPSYHPPHQSMPTLETYHGVYLWHYVPSLPLAITFAIVYGLATMTHGWKMVTTRMWFCLPFVIGCICASSRPSSTCSPTSATNIPSSLSRRDRLHSPGSCLQFHRRLATLHPASRVPAPTLPFFSPRHCTWYTLASSEPSGVRGSRPLPRVGRPPSLSSAMSSASRSNRTVLGCWSSRRLSSWAATSSLAG